MIHILRHPTFELLVRQTTFKRINLIRPTSRYLYPSQGLFNVSIRIQTLWAFNRSYSSESISSEAIEQFLYKVESKLAEMLSDKKGKSNTSLYKDEVLKLLNTRKGTITKGVFTKAGKL